MGPRRRQEPGSHHLLRKHYTPTLCALQRLPHHFSPPRSPNSASTRVLENGQGSLPEPQLPHPHQRSSYLPNFIKPLVQATPPPMVKRPRKSTSNSARKSAARRFPPSSSTPICRNTCANTYKRFLENKNYAPTGISAARPSTFSSAANNSARSLAKLKRCPRFLNL